MVINDGSSDRTKEIIEDFVGRDRRVELYDVPQGEGGKGKSRALNLALQRVHSEVIAVYDADNTPELRRAPLSRRSARAPPGGWCGPGEIPDE